MPDPGAPPAPPGPFVYGIAPRRPRNQAGLTAVWLAVEALCINLGRFDSVRQRRGPLLGMLGTTHWMTPTEPWPLCSETRSLVVVTGSKDTPLKVLSAAG